MSRLTNIGHRLYTGEVSYDFIGRRRLFYLISAALIGLSVAALLIRGLTFGIEFKGGADFKATTSTAVSSRTVDDMRSALERSGVPDLGESTINTIGSNQVRVQTRTLDPTTEVPAVRTAIAEELGVNSDQVAYSLIGASWGGQITEKALLALGVFLVLVTLVIWAYFRNGKMSAAALVALGHDLVLTIGIYALVGFTVTPATLIGVLTILGYSLYDTVVVFDKVRENVRDIGSNSTRTYGEAANLAVNQVLVRSINTTIIGVLPVAALLFAGAAILGEGPLKDLALALFVGMISGAYSSLFIATPLLVQLKERDPETKKHTARVLSRRAKVNAKSGGATALDRTAAATRQPKAAAVAGASTAAVAVLDDPDADDVQTLEPTDEDPTDDDELADDERAERSSAAPRITVSSVPAGSTTPPVVSTVKPLVDGAAKRPQPQNKPRSQRKK